MERMRSLIVAPVAVAALLTAGTAGAAVASPTSAALSCHASMSNNHPRDYTTTRVKVRTAADASVTTVAHYRTTNHKKTGRAGSAGNASIGYYISGATPGYRVVVSVRVVRGDRSGSCSTWFTPHL
jgi:hypothetical protein